MTALLRTNAAGLVQEFEAGARGIALVDFGAGSLDASIAITGQTGITAAHVPMACAAAVATADHSADEHIMEEIAVRCGPPVAGVGFTVYARSGTSELFGRYSIAWSWGA